MIRVSNFFVTGAYSHVGYKNFEYTQQLQTLLKDIPNVQAQAPRVYCGTLAFIDKKTTGVQLIGVDPFKARQLSTLADKVGEGQFLNTTSVEAPHNQTFHIHWNPCGVQFKAGYFSGSRGISGLGKER